jgi:hypothetical protein
MSVCSGFHCNISRPSSGGICYLVKGLQCFIALVPLLFSGCAENSSNRAGAVDQKPFFVNPFGELVSVRLEDGSVGFRIPFSAEQILPDEWFRKGDDRTMREVAAFLDSGLTNAGYFNLSFYAVTNGFALVTPFEQILEAGERVPNTIRWDISESVKFPVTPSQYFRHLFMAPNGVYRVFAFVVTDEPILMKDTYLELNSLQPWRRSGMAALTQNLNQRPFTAGHHCYALVYLFQVKTVPSAQGSIRDGRQINSSVPAIEHLQKSGLLESFKGLIKN